MARLADERLFVDYDSSILDKRTIRMVLVRGQLDYAQTWGREKAGLGSQLGGESIVVYNRFGYNRHLPRSRRLAK